MVDEIKQSPARSDRHLTSIPIPPHKLDIACNLFAILTDFADYELNFSAVPHNAYMSICFIPGVWKVCSAVLVEAVTDCKRMYNWVMRACKLLIFRPQFTERDGLRDLRLMLGGGWLLLRMREFGRMREW